MPSVFIHQPQIEDGLKKALTALGPDVVRINYSLEEDWRGNDAVFFRVLLKDKATVEPKLRLISRQVEESVFDAVRPDRLGIEAYFNFRAESELAELHEESW